MSNILKTGFRAGAMSFDNLQAYGSTPSTADIVIDGTAKRTGAGGVHCTIQSGVASTLVLTTTWPTSQTVGFYRFYVWFVSCPSSSRVFAGQSASTGSRITLRVTTTGTIELRFGTTTIGTSASTFATGQWHCIEIGIDGTNNFGKLRVNGNVEVDWVALGGSATLVETFMFGCLDTVAAAFQFYIDDFVWDGREFPGPGKVKMVKVFDVVSDNASWVLTGSTKPAALDPGTTFDDTTFLACSTNNASISFGLDTMPSDIVVINGITPWTRAQRTGASSASATVRTGWRGNGGTAESVTNIANIMSFTASFSVQSISGSNWSTIFGGFYPQEFQDQLTYGLITNSANAIKLTAFWVEVDYSDVAGETAYERPLQYGTFEESILGEFAPAGRTTAGTVNQVQTWSKFGSSSLEVVHASGGQSRLVFQLQDNQSNYSTAKFFTVSTWVYVTARPSSGNVHLISCTGFTLLMTSAGDCILNIDGNSSSSVGTIPLNTDTHIAVEVLFGTSGSANSRAKLYINDILVLTFTTTSTVLTVDSSTVFRLGATANVTGGATIRYDGYIVDGSIRHTTHLKFATLVPTGAGTYTAAGFTASAGSKYQCVDELPTNGDTDYETMATGLGTTTKETYTLTALPGTAVHVLQLVLGILEAKRDAGTNGAASVALRGSLSSIEALSESGSLVSGAAYASMTQFARSFGPHGQITPSLINGLEAGPRQRSNTVATRISTVTVGVAYTAINDYPHVHRDKVVMIG